MPNQVMVSSSSWNLNYDTIKYLTLALPNLKRKKSCRGRKTCNLLSNGVILLVSCLLFAEACQISEYYCDNRKCVSLDKFCNGIDDCGDGSDEPRHCSPCNRTFYGEVGGTYSIAVHRPSSRESQMPFVCQLTFAAGGGQSFGDLVQLIFNSVTLGPSDQDRYSSDKSSPTCRQGHVTLNEPDRPATAGHWCGHDWGQAVFYSETSRVTLTLSLFPGLASSSSSSSANFAFDFRLTYKFLRKSDSAVRYGPPSRPYFRGQLLPGTFCSLIYNSCDKEPCALQSPNFPGIYPRNVSCYYAIRQLAAPVGHRAVIKLSQDREHMVFVRNRAVTKKGAFVPGDSGGSSGISGDAGGGSKGGSFSSGGGSGLGGGGVGPGGGQDELTIGDGCDTGSDHVTIYDGYTIRDPVLLRFCGGGKFPTIVSSGNELLVEFFSAPTDYLLQSAVNTAIQGFHVDVEIKYLPLGSHSYVENHNCFMTLSSFQQKRGFLTSPQHSLPSRTTCTYLLEGSPGERVWISLLKFYVGKEYGRGGDTDGSGSGYSAAGLTSGNYLGSSSGEGPANYMAATMGQFPSSMSSVECNSTYFQIWQGTYNEKFNNATLLAHLCQDTPIQRTCEFLLTSTTSSKPPPRACHPDESFISKGPHMSLKLKVETTTVLRPAEFKLYYEFVDTKQDGAPFSHPGLTGGYPQNAPNLPKFLRTEYQQQQQQQQGNIPTSAEDGFGGGNINSMKFPVESCSRIWLSTNNAMQAATFTSPRNVFYFGRGGVSNLTCVYRFQGAKGQRVRVTFNKISLAGGFCKSEVNSMSGRSMCRDMTQNDTHAASAKHRVTEGRVQIWEVPWSQNDSRILKECLCDTDAGPFSFLSVSSTMDIVLSVRNMQPFHDQDHFTFEGSYEFIKHPGCSRSQKLKAPSGSITLKQPEKVPHQSCSHYPWEIQPHSPSHYIYLRVPGRTMKKFPTSSFHQHSKSSPYSSSSYTTPNSNQEGHTRSSSSKCDTRNRILIYSGGFSGHLLQIICPHDESISSSGSGGNYVEIYSLGWPNSQHNQKGREVDPDYPNFVSHPHLSLTNMPSSNQLIVELVSRGPGSNARYELKYIQISRRDEPLDWGVLGPSSTTTTVLTGSGAVITTSSGGAEGGLGHKIVTPGSGSGSGGSSSGMSSGGLGGTSSSITLTSSRDEKLEEDVCFGYKCPELDACISPSLFCDGEQHCPSGHDEAECVYFPVPKTYLVLAAASLITFLLLSCCFGCLVCKKRRAERRDKLLMSSRTPTEEMFFGGGGTGTMSLGSGGGGGTAGGGVMAGSHAHHLHHHHHREITC